MGSNTRVGTAKTTKTAQQVASGNGHASAEQLQLLDDPEGGLRITFVG